MAAGSAVQEFIAVRSRREVNDAADLADLDTRPRARGRAAAYRWVLDPDRAAPVTGARRDPLEELDLAVEERAAIERARDDGCPTATRAFALGVAQALGWVLGFAPLVD